MQDVVISALLFGLGAQSMHDPKSNLISTLKEYKVKLAYCGYHLTDLPKVLMYFTLIIVTSISPRTTSTDNH